MLHLSKNCIQAVEDNILFAQQCLASSTNSIPPPPHPSPFPKHPSFVCPSHIGPVASAVRAVPLALGLVSQSHTVEVKPLDFALKVVAANHLAVGDLVAEAVGGLVGVDGEVQRGPFPLLLHHLALLLLLGAGPLVLLLLQATEESGMGSGMGIEFSIILTTVAIFPVGTHSLLHDSKEQRI